MPNETLLAHLPDTYYATDMSEASYHICSGWNKCTQADMILPIHEILEYALN